VTEERKNEHNLHRLVISRGEGSEVLLLRWGADYELPSVDVPPQVRFGEYLTTEIKNGWGQEVVCLFALPALCDGEARNIRYQVMESYGTAETGARLEWIPSSCLGLLKLSQRTENKVIRQGLNTWEQYRAGFAPGPFAKPGWFGELRTWTAEAISAVGQRLTSGFRQLNAAPNFSLVRFETSGPAIWFKAVGEPNLREFATTRTLAELVPEFVPEIVGVRPDWNGWLALEAAGRGLGDTGNVEDWTKAATAFAELQIALIGKQNPFLNSGAHDLRLRTLALRVDEFMRTAAALMEEQAKPSPAPLNDAEIRALGVQLTEALALLEGLGLPEQLGHLDLSTGNILVSPQGCTFLDWAEAYVGHPFLSYNFLLEHFRRRNSSIHSHESKLRVAYLKPWSRYLSPHTIGEAMRYAPLIAVFAYAVALLPDGLKDPNSGAYLRSLIRRMKREADQLSCRRSLCAIS
jgi:Phosphotransferase enzyme family